MLPSPPITRNQIELMRRDNIASGEIPGLASLEITPTALEQVLAEVLEKAR
ncbi:hypothetical protein [Pelagibacterium sp. H642]|uniref:hypothetical protein n=1 Tax=Pelagibacterium sp. H642 TaxID=1881069 RepID=UPI00281695E6|nr:hypothetical protein [Pelagibacterium sp. H642]WMT92780.1 hypothetical protein NO934_18520 [Pelagibacterium sp. H642]